MKMRKPFFVTGPHNALLVAGIVGFLFFFDGIISAFNVGYDMRILEVQPVCEQPLNNRCVYQYSVEQGNGTLSKIKLPGYMFSDSELAVGNKIKKSRYSFEYQVNEKLVSWGFSGHYLTIFVLSLFALSLWRYSTPDSKISVS